MRQLLVGLIVIITFSAFGQSQRDRTDALKLIDPKTYQTYKSSFPITRDTLGNYPDSLSLKGTIIDYTRGISCGYFCGCGTVKIRLSEKVDGYPFEYIYVAVGCLNEVTNELLATRNWKLYKLALNDKRCYWTELPINKFDTGICLFTYCVNKEKRTNRPVTINKKRNIIFRKLSPDGLLRDSK